MAAFIRSTKFQHACSTRPVMKGLFVRAQRAAGIRISPAGSPDFAAGRRVYARQSLDAHRSHGPRMIFARTAAVAGDNRVPVRPRRVPPPPFKRRHKRSAQ